jgi:hypothetical protein
MLNRPHGGEFNRSCMDLTAGLATDRIDQERADDSLGIYCICLILKETILLDSCGISSKPR